MAAKPGNSKSSAGFLTGGYAVLAIGFLLLAVMPWVRGVRSAQSDIVQFQQEIQSRQSRSQRLEEIKRQITVISGVTRDYDRLVPPDDDLGAFLAAVSKQFDDAGMHNLSKSNMAKTPLGRTQKLPIELRGNGTYAQVQVFLKKLENLPRLCSVGRLNIDAETDMGGDVELHLILYIYSAKPASLP